SWLKPWVERSVERNRSYLSQDSWFLSAAVLWEQERRAEAVPRLIAITKFFPQSEYREDVYQLLGDHYFEIGSFKQALPHYGRLAEVGSVDKAAYGVYKASWAFYNLGEKWKALRHLERLILNYHLSGLGNDQVS